MRVAGATASRWPTPSTTSAESATKPRSRAHCTRRPARRACCENDDAAACYWLGYSLDRGIGGLAKDAEKGRAFKEKACQLDGEAAEACERLLMNLALEAP